MVLPFFLNKRQDNRVLPGSWTPFYVFIINQIPRTDSNLYDSLDVPRQCFKENLSSHLILQRIRVFILTHSVAVNPRPFRSEVKAPLRVNPERAQAFMPKSRRVDK